MRDILNLYRCIFLKLAEIKGLYYPSLQPENDFGLDSLTPPTADLKCAPTSIIYGIVIIFDARYPKSVSLNFLETFSN